MKSDDIATEAVTALAPILTPHGRLLLEPADDAMALTSDLLHRLRKARSADRYHADLQPHGGGSSLAASGYLQFGFFRGSSPCDPGGLLEGTGQYVRHRTVHDASEIDQQGLLRDVGKLRVR